MARDLIPPSSPAGRPAPDGTPNLIELPPEPPRSPAASRRCAEPFGPSQFRNRFGFLLGALAGILIAAALVGVVVLSTGRGARRGEPGAELVPVAADGHDRAGRRDRRSPRTSRASTATRRASRSRWSGRSRSRRPRRAARRVGHDQPRSRRPGDHLRGGRARPAQVDPGQGHRGAPAAGPARGARARALHLPLPAGGPAGRDQAAAAAADRGPDSRAEGTPTRPGCSPTPRSSRRGRPARRRTTSRRRRRSRSRRRTATDTVPDGARRAVFYRPGDLRLQLEKPLGRPSRPSASRSRTTSRRMS